MAEHTTVKRREPVLVPLVWLTVSGGASCAATSNPWTYSPQLGITIRGAWVMARAA